MKNWKLDRQGFVTNFMVSGPKEESYEYSNNKNSQLELEGYLRSVIAEHKELSDVGDIKAGHNSRLGMPWKYYYEYGSTVIDLSAFYSLVRKTSFDAATVLCADEDINVKAAVWSYAAADIYCNGKKLGMIKQPVYKPIQKLVITLPLHKGENLVYLACENLGVRDTRNVIMLQLMDHRDKVTVTLPDKSCAEAVYEAREVLDNADLQTNLIKFQSSVPEGTEYTYDHDSDDLKKALLPRRWVKAAGNEILLKAGEAEVSVRITAADKCNSENKMVLERKFERTEQIIPEYSDGPLDYEGNKKEIFKRIAAVSSLNRGEGIGFPIANILARKHLGISDSGDEKLFMEMLDLIEERYDCADFLMCGLIRYIHLYPVKGEAEKRVKEVICGFRYWMNMEGTDGMCYWSENHSLMFYSCAMQAGELYPDEYFFRAKMTGKQLQEYGRSMVLQWLEDVEKYGFEEFLSTVYMCVTFAALLNVIDYSETEISARASAITDKLLSMLALHVYKDGLIAPMGRVYRSVLYPFKQEAMALMNLINPELPYSFGEGWLGFYTTSKYRIPKGLCSLMKENAEINYVTGNARIYLEKNDEYCITSVASPREKFVRWENETLREGADTSLHSFTKSFNERFHGTTCFAPGVYGYQQHMWYAALDGEAVIFATHPGSTSEGGDMRPGYWHGNGIMPALKQEHGMLGAIYNISAEHPLHYTHLYLPECRFETVEKEDSWIFMKKGNGYMALWCSVPLTAFNGRNYHCEQRAYADEMAYLCVCGGKKDDGSFEGFKNRVKALNPVFDVETQKLTAGDFVLSWKKGEDRTQYL